MPLDGPRKIVHVATRSICLMYSVWTRAMARRGTARAPSTHLLVPVVSGLVSALCFAEPSPPLTVAGAAWVLVGLLGVRHR